MNSVPLHRLIVKHPFGLILSLAFLAYIGWIEPLLHRLQQP